MATTTNADGRASSWLRRAVSDCPRLPPPILSVLAPLGNGEMSYEQLRPALDETVGLKQRLLTIANSPFYSPTTPIADVARAAVTIGQRQLVGLTLAHGIHRTLRTGAVCHGHDHNGLLVHSLAVAATAWAIAESCGLPAELSGKIYIAGLFHDLGKVLIGRRWRDLDLRDTPDEAPGLVALEQTRFGIDHVEASVLLAEHWQLDSRVIELIAGHHAPGSTDRASAILHFADHLAGAQGLGFLADLPAETPLDPDSMSGLSDDPEFFVLAEQHALEESARAATTLELLL